MIDLNWTEILLLMVLGVIMFGPEKLPELARKAARIIAYLRTVGNDARGQLRAELGPEFDDIRLSDLNPKNFVSRHLLSPEDKDDLLSIRDEFRSVGSLASEGLNDVRTGIEGGSGSTAVTTLEEEASSGTYADDPAGSDLLRAVAFDPEAT